MLTFLPEQHYPNAPIAEAIIDLVVRPAPGLSMDLLEGVRDSDYSKKECIFVNEVQFNGASTTTNQQPIGWRFGREDGLCFYQARLNGFSASRLAPYHRWDSFSQEVRRLWDNYRTNTRPLAVQRLSVRYVNRIDIPLPLNDFGDYLQTFPMVSPHLPQTLSSYLMSLTIPFGESVNAVITQAILSGKAAEPAGLRSTWKEALSLLLDIDVSLQVAAPPDEDEIWTQLEYLRKVKNHVFESCITDQTRELFR